MSLSCTKYSNTLDILLLRTNMSEWNVWVTMPQVAAATSLPNTLQQQTALSRSAPGLYLSRPSIALYFSVSASVFVPSQHCISVRVPTISTASSRLFPLCTVVSSPICTLWIVVGHMSFLECYSPALENLFHLHVQSKTSGHIFGCFSFQRVLLTIISSDSIPRDIFQITQI